MWRESEEKLFKLMQDNPDFPIIPMVDSDVVCDGYGKWKGEIYDCEIREYVNIVDEFCGYYYSGIYYKNEDERALEEYFVDKVQENIDMDCMNEQREWNEIDDARRDKEVKEAMEKVKWVKAIFVYIGV